MSKELLPCPFCGSPAEWLKYSDGENFVRCESKLCRAETGTFPNKGLAVKAWSQRLPSHNSDKTICKELLQIINNSEAIKASPAVTLFVIKEKLEKHIV